MLINIYEVPRYYYVEEIWRPRLKRIVENLEDKPKLYGRKKSSKAKPIVKYNGKFRGTVYSNGKVFHDEEVTIKYV